jgi:hypothetical protein
MVVLLLNGPRPTPSDAGDARAGQAAGSLIWCPAGEWASADLVR